MTGVTSTVLITQLHIRGFKSLHNVEINLNKITILIGLNGSGKSSIIQALGILKQSLGHQSLVTSGELLNLGSFNDILSHKMENLTFSLGGVRHVDAPPKGSISVG